MKPAGVQCIPETHGTFTQRIRAEASAAVPIRWYKLGNIKIWYGLAPSPLELRGRWWWPGSGGLDPAAAEGKKMKPPAV